MSIPANLKYTKEHEWVRVEGDVAYVGITDYAQSELGEIVFVEVETVGESLAAGEVFGTVEAVKTVSELFLPVNTALEDPLELVKEDPYGKGWMVKLSVADAAQLDGLLSATDYETLIGA